MFENFLIWEEDMAAAGVAPCGMFSPTHIIVFVACLLLLSYAVYRSRGLSEECLNRISLYVAVLVTVLELCKIVFNLVHGGFTPNHWLPLTFCSFAIYAYWMVALGNKTVKEIAKGYLCGGGIIAGFSFLLAPMTSVATYPMFHFLPCYSMLFHSLMMYIGLSYVVNGYYHFNKDGYRKFFLFCAPACLIALVLNVVYAAVTGDVAACNMMFLSHPFRLSEIMPFIGRLYEHLPFVYTLGVFTVYLTLPYFIPFGIAKLLEAFGFNKQETETVQIKENA